MSLPYWSPTHFLPFGVHHFSFSRADWPYLCGGHALTVWMVPCVHSGNSCTTFTFVIYRTVLGLWVPDCDCEPDEGKQSKHDGAGACAAWFFDITDNAGSVLPTCFQRACKRKRDVGIYGVRMDRARVHCLYLPPSLSPFSSRSPQSCLFSEFLSFHFPQRCIPTHRDDCYLNGSPYCLGGSPHYFGGSPHHLH